MALALVELSYNDTRNGRAATASTLAMVGPPSANTRIGRVAADQVRENTGANATFIRARVGILACRGARRIARHPLVGMALLASRRAWPK